MINQYPGRDANGKYVPDANDIESIRLNSLNSEQIKTGTIILSNVTNDTRGQVLHLFIDGQAKKLSVPLNSVWQFVANLTAVDTVSGDVLGRQFLGVIKNIADVVTVLENDVPVSTYDSLHVQDTALDTAVAIIADTSSATEKALVISVAGVNGRNIKWTASITLTPLHY